MTSHGVNWIKEHISFCFISRTFACATFDFIIFQEMQGIPHCLSAYDATRLTWQTLLKNRARTCASIRLHIFTKPRRFSCNNENSFFTHFPPEKFAFFSKFDFSSQKTLQILWFTWDKLSTFSQNRLFSRPHFTSSKIDFHSRLSTFSRKNPTNSFTWAIFHCIYSLICLFSHFN